ncbi:hypothetical protein F5Y01DRAFT_298090 [Xylaria sp. FL0043]|nr:hypothetical protein F5Y01DRAFT_298090 [Xylaria sp. FL0043]
MADPLSIGASILTFIGLADRIIRVSRYCIEIIQDAPNDIQMILGEATSLKAIIENFGKLEWHTNSTTNLVPSLFGKTGPLDACRRCLSGLEGLLPPVVHGSPLAKQRKITIAKLAWP